MIDRGPGAAGDLGQANYGGGVHLFSPTVSDSFSIDQWDTWDAVTVIQSGAIEQTGGTKILAMFDYRSSNTELSFSPAMAYNSLIKIIQPINDHSSLTFFFTEQYTRYL